MRLILLLITVVIVGFLLDKNINTDSSDTEYSLDKIENGIVPEPPRNQKEVLKLKQDINKLMLDTADKRSKSIEQSLNN
jgi:hypothetical protein